MSRWWVRPATSPDARVRLVGFPHAGGAAASYGAWATHLPSWIEVSAIELPGRGVRFGEPCETRMDLAVCAIADALASPGSSLPLALFGHSLGATLAFEVARELRRRRAPRVVHLFVSGRRAPHLPDDDVELYARPRAELVAELASLGGTPSKVLDNPELLDVFLPIVRGDFELLGRYRHVAEAPLACAVTAFGGEDDRRSTRHHIEAWRQHTSGPFAAHVLPGGHFFVHGAMVAVLELVARDLAPWSVAA